MSDLDERLAKHRLESARRACERLEEATDRVFGAKVRSVVFEPQREAFRWVKLLKEAFYVAAIVGIGYVLVWLVFAGF